MFRASSTWYRISIKALIFNKKWKVLLCKENTNIWDLPWGWLNHEETPEDCLRRELQEEMWIEIKWIAKIPKYFVKSPNPTSKRKPRLANICYEIKVKNLKFIPSNECTEIWFFDSSEITELNTLSTIKELAKEMKKDDLQSKS